MIFFYAMLINSIATIETAICNTIPTAWPTTENNLPIDMSLKRCRTNLATQIKKNSILIPYKLVTNVYRLQDKT